MDEEDGRLGPRALKSGRVDVLTDALTSSLCDQPEHFSRVLQVPILGLALDLRTHKDPIQSEVMP